MIFCIHIPAACMETFKIKEGRLSKPLSLCISV